MSINFQIRNEEIKDIRQVRQILKATFPSDAESRLADSLRRDEQVLGHILFRPVTTSPPSEAKGIGLAPVAVRSDVQSQGIGSSLIKEGLRLCHELGYDYCVVLDDPNYYHRFGFQKANNFGL